MDHDTTPWIHPKPWQYCGPEEHQHVVWQQPRSQMEIDLYKAMCHLLYMPGIFQNQNDEKFWFQWHEKVSCARTKPFFSCLHVMTWLQQCLAYCEKMLQEMKFTMAGIVGVWMCPIPFSQQWEKKWLTQLAHDSVLHEQDKEDRVQHLLHPGWYPMDFITWQPSTWDCEKKQWKNLISGLHPTNQKEIYDELNDLIQKTMGMISQSLVSKHFGHTWFSTAKIERMYDFCPEFSPCLVPIWPRSGKGKEGVFVVHPHPIIGEKNLFLNFHLLYVFLI